MKTGIKLFFSSLFLSLLLILPSLVAAQETQVPEPSTDLTSRLRSVALFGGYNVEGPTITTVIGTVIRVALSFLGIIFLVMMVIAGYNWMTASGNDETIKKSKGTIKQAIIGLIVVLFSYAIWNFLFARLISGGI